MDTINLGVPHVFLSVTGKSECEKTTDRIINHNVIYELRTF